MAYLEIVVIITVVYDVSAVRFDVRRHGGRAGEGGNI